MRKAGFVYGKFFSDAPARPCDSAISEAPRNGCAALCSLSAGEVSRRLTGGHKFYSFLIGGKRLFSFWVGAGGVCKIPAGNGYHPISSPFIYGLTAPFPSDPIQAAAFLTCAEAFLKRPGSSKTLLFLDARIPAAYRKSLGLYELATYARSSAGAECTLLHPVQWHDSILGRFQKRAPRLFSLASRVLSASRLRRYEMSGAVSGRKFILLFNGPGAMAGFYSNIIFSALGVRASDIGDTAYPRQKAAPDVEITWRAGGSGNRVKGMVLPAFIRFIVPISGSYEDYQKSLGNSAQNDIKKIQKNGLSSMLSRDPLDFMLFYLSMYLPMLESRHRGHSIYVPFDSLLRYFLHGFLILIMKGPSPISALVAVCHGDTLVGKTMGVAEGAREHTRAGANSAILYYHVRHAFEMGFKVADMGYGSPFACDGLFRYKKKWGAEVVADRGTDVIVLRFKDKTTEQEFISSCSPLALASLPEYDAPEL